RNGEAAPRPGHAPGRAARIRDFAWRHDDRRDSRARAGRGSRGVPQRDPGCDGSLARARRGRLSSVDIIVVADAEEAARLVAERIAEQARAGSIVLTGGSTPRRAYELAAQLEPDWSRAELWWGDERCVPPDDENSNYGMAKTALLDRLDREPAGVHRMHG